MTTTPKPLASLSPGLLARKGAARPAMRPQLQPLHQFHETAARSVNEDLGWNDMGHDESQNVPVEQAAAELPPAEVVPLNNAEPVAPAEVPEVVRLHADMATRLAASGKRRSALSDGRRAAFTLRLDADRHLKLRLASVVANRSAQQLVTEALDQFLVGMSEVDSLSDQVRKRGKKS